MRLLLLAFAFSLLLTGCTALTINEENVFYPKPSVTPETFDLEDVTLTSSFVPVADSISLNTWHLTTPDARATVLFFGGNGFYLVQSRSYLRALTRPSVDAVLWDYRGYGRSDGDPGVEAFRRDALAMYDHVVEEMDVAPDRLVVWGHSLGSFLATHVADRRPVAGLVLENPATNVDDWVGHLMPWYLRLFLGVDVDPALREEDNLRRIREITAPLLVVGGGQDEVTDPTMARELHDASAADDRELVIVEEGEHNGLHEHSSVQAAYQEFLGRALAGTETHE